MVRRKRSKKRRKRREAREWVLSLLGLGVVAGWLVYEMATAKLGWQKRRINLLFIGKGKDGVVVSVDQIGMKVDSLDFPQDSLLKSKSKGYYQVGKLMALAEYEPRPMSFVVAKFQGFLKIPIQAYCRVRKEVELGEKVGLGWVWRCRETNLNFLDKLRLSYLLHKYSLDSKTESDWWRLGILVGDKKEYDSLRLEEYMKDRFFDWLVAKEGLEIAVVDESGHDLGEDLATLLENLGIHVVMVKTKDQVRPRSELRVSRRELLKSWSVAAVKESLKVDKVAVGRVDEYRADLVILVGRDLLSLF